MTMALALTVIALLGFIGIRRTLVAQLDRSLRATVELEARAYAGQGAITELPDFGADVERFVREVNRFIAVRDTLGRVLAVNMDAARRLPLDSVALRRAMAGGTALVTGRSAEHTLRMLYRRMPAGDTSQAVILQVGASLQPLLQAARVDLWLMLATAGVGALAALVGSWWLATSALAPVAAIASQARRIEGNASGQQITAHVHDQELQGLIAVLNDMISRLERSREWHRRIIRDLGHDLRTPLAAMRACVEVSLRGERSADAYRGALRSNLEEIERLTLLSDALVLLGRLENGELTPVPVRTDIAELAQNAATRAASRVDAGSRLRPAPQAEAWARVDRDLLGKALDQLIDNAIRHAPEATRIDVSARHADGRIELTVEDDGPGVPEALLPHLFERFFRGDEARGRDAGPGLGLTAVAAIAELHQGTVTADRGTLGGLRVRMQIPAE